MNETVTLELPRELLVKARAAARATNRRFEAAVADWIERGLGDDPVEELPDDRVLELARSMLPVAEQEELSGLLSANGEGELDGSGRNRLDEMMMVYRRSQVLKARAIREAVHRGLMPRLDDHAS
jgi:hypothetical protein